MNTSPDHFTPPAPSATHTPTPWVTAQFDDVPRVVYIYANGKEVAVLYGGSQSEQDAAMIVRAVNSFDAMRETLEKLCGTFDKEMRSLTDNNFWGGDFEVYREARAALALATPPEQE